MKKLYLKLFSFLFLAGIFPFHSLCQDYVNWNVAEKYTADSLSGHYRSSLSATWIPDTHHFYYACLLYTSPSPRDVEESRMPSSA